MTSITVTHLAEDLFRVQVRGHELLVDQPRPGAEDARPSPTELFVTSLAACVGYYATQFLREHELSHAGLRVDCDWRMLAATPARVGRIDLRIVPPAPVPPHLSQPLQEAMESCTVHNSLHHPPRVTITTAGADSPIP